jgi:hypothetical protein
MDREIFVSCAILRRKIIKSEMNTSRIRASCCRFRDDSSESWDSSSGVFQIICLIVLATVEHEIARGPKDSAKLSSIIVASIPSLWRIRMRLYWFILRTGFLNSQLDIIWERCWSDRSLSKNNCNLKSVIFRFYLREIAKSINARH